MTRIEQLEWRVQQLSANAWHIAVASRPSQWQPSVHVSPLPHLLPAVKIPAHFVDWHFFCRAQLGIYTKKKRRKVRNLRFPAEKTWLLTADCSLERGAKGVGNAATWFNSKTAMENRNAAAKSQCNSNKKQQQCERNQSTMQSLLNAAAPDYSDARITEYPNSRWPKGAGAAASQRKVAKATIKYFYAANWSLKRADVAIVASELRRIQTQT